jgi:hypothetical protein
MDGMIRVLNPDGNKKLYLLQIVKTASKALAREFFPRVKEARACY